MVMNTPAKNSFDHCGGQDTRLGKMEKMKSMDSLTNLCIGGAIATAAIIMYEKCRNSGNDSTNKDDGEGPQELLLRTPSRTARRVAAQVDNREYCTTICLTGGPCGGKSSCLEVCVLLHVA